MNHKIIKNISFVFCSNVIATIGSALLAILIPKLISIEDYGYWQLYSLYGGYVALLHFGWIDGVYVRYAGIPYEHLNKTIHHTQFFLLWLVEACISITGIISCCLFINDLNKRYVLSMLLLGTMFSLPCSYLLYLMQGCDRIKDYSILTILSKLVYLFLSLLMFIFGLKSYRLIIVAALVGTLVTFVTATVKCKDIVFRKGFTPINPALRETLANIKCGLKVSIAYLAGTFIVGSVRNLIENEWGIETFGKASLTISLSHLLLLFINAVGLVMLPLIRNIKEETQKSTYENLYNILTVVLCLSYVAYYPMSKILVFILPQYADSIQMMALIFPICLYEAKMGLLNTTYMKALRKENALLIINVITCILTCFLGWIIVKVLKNFEFSVILIMIMLAFRSWLSDLYIKKVIKVDIMPMFIIGNLLSFIFVVLNKYLENELSQVLCYTAVLIFMFILAYKSIKKSVSWAVLGFKENNSGEEN